MRLNGDSSLKYAFEWWTTLINYISIVGHPENVRFNGGSHLKVRLVRHHYNVRYNCRPPLKCAFEWWATITMFV